MKCQNVSLSYDETKMTCTGYPAACLVFAAFNSSEEFLENSMELHFAIIPSRGYAFCVDSMEFYRSVRIRPLNCTMSLDYTLSAFALR